MPDRSMFALFALPILILVATLYPSSSTTPEPVSSSNPPKTEPARQGVKVGPLLSACDVVADYLGIAPVGDAGDTGPILEINARVGTRQATLNVSDKKDQKPKDCASRVRGSLHGTLDTAFVFIPDPTGSALALETDRALDAIRLAMSDENFVPYKSNVLPWKSPRATDKEEKKPNGESPDEVRPGVWLFRSKDTRQTVRLKLLFLIGDSPTAGISKWQFKNAVEQSVALSCSMYHGCSNDGWTNRMTPLNVVGPFFSGSVDSLALVLNQMCDSRPRDYPCWDVRATSGTAEVACLESSLSKAVGAHAKVSLKQIAKHHSVERLVDRLGDPTRTAILTESDTVFGLESVAYEETEGDSLDCTIKSGIFKASVFNYSRNLLNLRTAYEADRDLMSRIFPKSLRAEQLALHFGSAHDPSDALPTYASENLAVSQQFLLRHLASKLRRQRFANLIIAGSDNLDSVFLARFFQDENPNLRIAVVDSDVLLDRQAGAVSLRGVLTVAQAPTGSISFRKHELPSGQSLGIYRACRQQLFGAADFANTVVSVVGFDGEWPLELLEPRTKRNAGRDTNFEDKEYFWQGPLLAFSVVVVWLAVAPSVYPLLFLRWFSLHVLSRRVLSSGVISRQKLFAIFRVVQHRLYGLLRLVPYCRVAAVPGNLSEDRKDSERLRRNYIAAACLVGWFILIALLCIILWELRTDMSYVESRAIVARYFYFSAGVSPILPLIALLFVFHACAWSRVRCFYLQSFTFRPMPHPLPYSDSDPTTASDELEFLLVAVRKNASTFFSGWSLFTFGGFAALVVWTYDLSVGTVELVWPAFLSRYVWTVLFGCAGVLIVNAAVRVGLLWISLRDLLRRLEYHPLRLGFTELPDRVSWTSIWSPSGLRPTMVSLQMSGDYLAAIDGVDTSRSNRSLPLQRRIRSFMAKVSSGSLLIYPGALRDLDKIERSMKRQTSRFRQDLVKSEYWTEQRIDGWNSGAALEAKKDRPAYRLPLHVTRGESGTFTVEQSPEPPESSVNKRKAQFIALQYAAFIRYAFMQLRNLLGFLMTASTLVFIALNVYPFSPIGSLTNFATFLFVLSSIVVVTMFYQMECDPLLSRLSNTAAGKLDAGFGWRLAQFGALPAVTFLATHFPPIGQALVRIVQIVPGLAKL